MTPNIPLLAWSPDSDPTTPGVIADLTNLLPTQRGYTPERTLGDSGWSVTAGALPTRCYGAALVRFATYTPVVVAGTGTDLYSYFGNTLNYLTRASAPYVEITSAYDAWKFAAFEDTTLAVSPYNVLQATAGAASGVAFADVPDAPAAGTMCVQSNFVLLGRFNSGAYPYQDGVWCSGIETYTDWDADLATQGKQMRLLQTPGAIVRLYAFNNYVIAFKQNSMLRGTYVGTPTVWRWDVISTSVGLVGHDAVCDAGGVLYWLAEDGFYRFDGGSVQRIASAPFEWMATTVDLFSGVTGDTQAQWDHVRRCVRWYYPSSGTSGLDSGLAYHPGTDRWGRFSQSIEWAAHTYSDTVYRATASVEHLYPPAVFDTSHMLSVYNGIPRDSTITTGDVGDDDAVLAAMRVRVRFLTGADSSALTHSYRMNLPDGLTTGATISRDDGKYDVTHGARWHRFTLSQTGYYELMGFSVDAKPAGKR